MRAGSVVADDEVFFTVVGAADKNVARWKTGIEEALLHRLRDGGDAAYGVGAVDVDDLAEDVEGELFGGGIGRRVRSRCLRDGGQGSEVQSEDQDCEAISHGVDSCCR